LHKRTEKKLYNLLGWNSKYWDIFTADPVKALHFDILV